MMLRHLVTWSYDRRRRVLALWVAALATISILAAVAGGETTVDYRTPGSDSSAALTVLEDRLPELSGATIEVIYRADAGVDDPIVASRIAALAADLRTVDHVVGTDAGPVSPDGRTGVRSSVSTRAPRRSPSRRRMTSWSRLGARRAVASRSS